jgi:hypothetical protein
MGPAATLLPSPPPIADRIALGAPTHTFRLASSTA